MFGFSCVLDRLASFANPPQWICLQNQAFQIRIFNLKVRSWRGFRTKPAAQVLGKCIVHLFCSQTWSSTQNRSKQSGKQHVVVCVVLCCFRGHPTSHVASERIIPYYLTSPRPGPFLQGFPCMARENLQQGHPLRITGHTKTPQNLKHSHEENNTSWPILARNGRFFLEKGWHFFLEGTLVQMEIKYSLTWKRNGPIHINSWHL